MKTPLALLLCACAAAAAAQPLNDNARLVQALRAAGELDPERGLAHVSHVCDLLIDGRRHPVADVRELVRGATTPRGVNRIVVLTPQLRPLQRIGYARERPLLCRADRLYVDGAIAVDGAEGNVLVFTDHGRRVALETVDVNDWPLYPPAAGR